MSTTTTAETELEHYSLLRFFHQADKSAVVYYCQDKSTSWAKKRDWCQTDNRDLAYKFSKRDDARRAADAACWRHIDEGYKWEVVEVDEVRVVTHSFIESVVASNASPLVQLARQSE